MRAALPALLLFVACSRDPVIPEPMAVPNELGPMLITNGTLDGSAHPYVGLMVAQDNQGTPLWRCSGTLLNSTIFLTAGHCTVPPAARVEIWFAADVESGIPGNGYPFNGDADGTPYTHPLFSTQFYDVGVVRLNAPWTASAYGALPAPNVLDQLTTQRGKQQVSFTTVGYGLQYTSPVSTQGLRVRMFATPKLLQINNAFVGSTFVVISGNHATGGVCFGDSGGPSFIESSNVVAGVSSLVLNDYCRGAGVIFRVDRSAVLSWLATFGVTP